MRGGSGEASEVEKARGTEEKGRPHLHVVSIIHPTLLAGGQGLQGGHEMKSMLIRRLQADETGAMSAGGRCGKPFFCGT